MQQSRHCFEYGHFLGFGITKQLLRIAGHFVGHDEDAGTAKKRGRELPDRNIESLGGGLRDDIRRSKPEHGNLAPKMIDQTSLRHHRSLRDTG